MNKSLKIIIIVVVIIAVLVIIGSVAFVMLAKDKEPITSETFKSIMEQKGYTVVDANSQFSGNNEIKQVYVAVDGNEKYQIEFYELIDESSANLFYSNNQNIIESKKGNVSSENSVNLKNYAKYTMNSNGKYATISKIENTVIYLFVNNDYKDTVKELLEEIGY